MVIRPENIRIVSGQTFENNLLNATVHSILFTGTSTRLKVNKGSQRIEILTSFEEAKNYQKGDPIQLHLPAQKLWICSDQRKDMTQI